MALTTKIGVRRSGLAFVLGSMLLASTSACSSASDGVAGPRLTPISAEDGGYNGADESFAGEGGDTGTTDPGIDPGVDPGTDPGSDPGADPGSDPGADPAPAPTNAPGCGANGNACCVNGNACFDNKAQCCTECSGAPDFTCHCFNSYQQGGNCRLCCVVCNNGKVKADPLYVSGSSCQVAAQAWCKSTFNVGADPKSGWRANC
jgi:hypothetical protein